MKEDDYFLAEAITAIELSQLIMKLKDAGYRLFGHTFTQAHDYGEQGTQYYYCQAMIRGDWNIA